jgi:hypothetical protein
MGKADEIGVRISRATGGLCKWECKTMLPAQETDGARRVYSRQLSWAEKETWGGVVGGRMGSETQRAVEEYLEERVHVT